MRVHLLDTPIDILDLEATMARCEQAMASRALCVHVAMNAAKFVKMRSDEELDRDVRSADIIGIDGMGIVLALRLFGLHNAPKVSGVDLMMHLLGHCARHGRHPYILGAKQGVLDRAITAAQKRWPELVMAGARNGYFGAADEADIVTNIRNSGADCLFIAMPTPRKERFLAQYAEDLGVPFIMGVGGSVDVLAGHVSRAPTWMQRSGLEWLHRLVQEPRKMFWRYASTNGRFLAVVIGGRLRGAKLMRSD